MNYKLVGYKATLNSTINLEFDVTPVGITQVNETEFYVLVLEPVKESEKKEKPEGDKEP